MTLVQSVLLGILQGLTEFLPVSSSGHLVILEKVFGIAVSVPFFVLLHLATMLAVVVYFWKDILDLIKNFLSGIWRILADRVPVRAVYYSNTQFKTCCLLLLGTLVTGAIGIAFKEKFEALFTAILPVGIFLVLTGVLIVVAERIGKGTRFAAQMNFVDALIIGLFQGFAIAPGLSRSGATISASLAVGLKRDFAARFSFLLAIPAILAAVLVERHELLRIAETGIGMKNMIAGFIAAFVVGLLSIKIFMAIIRKTSLRAFAYYCFIVGISAIVWSFL